MYVYVISDRTIEFEFRTVMTREMRQNISQRFLPGDGNPTDIKTIQKTRTLRIAKKGRKTTKKMRTISHKCFPGILGKFAQKMGLHRVIYRWIFNPWLTM